MVITAARVCQRAFVTSGSSTIRMGFNGACVHVPPPRGVRVWGEPSPALTRRRPLRGPDWLPGRWRNRHLRFVLCPAIPLWAASLALAGRNQGLGGPWVWHPQHRPAPLQRPPIVRGHQRNHERIFSMPACQGGRENSAVWHWAGLQSTRYLVRWAYLTWRTWPDSLIMTILLPSATLFLFAYIVILLPCLSSS